MEPVIVLAQLAAELRALRDAQREVDRATDALIENISRNGQPKTWAARVRFNNAMADLQLAEARFEFTRSRLAGRRHLRLAWSSDHREGTTQS